MTTVEGGGVKSERLSPAGGGGGESSSSRSGTPSSSYPGTPPTTSPTHPTPRNYSDFMRTLAAKYNNNHPNDYFSSRNGLSKGLGGSKEDGDVKDSATPNMLGFVPFLPPMVEATTQALLTMVRQGANNPHLEGYLKAVKRGSEPLDLSTSSAPPKPVPVPIKRPKKTSLSEALYGTDIVPLLRQGRKPLSPRPRRPNSTSKPCTSACSPCTPDSQVISLWSVEDVASFVSTVDICAEYASNFREQKIDGSSLSLLTEEHLTGSLGMKLGPALKLKTILSAKLGQCVICQHCVHCHQQPPDK